MRHETNTDAAEATIAALDGFGRLETVDAAKVQMVRSLAAAVDGRPHSPGLWQEYREALERLTADDDDDGASDDALREWLSSPVRKPPAA